MFSIDKAKYTSFFQYLYCSIFGVRVATFLRFRDNRDQHFSDELAHTLESLQPQHNLDTLFKNQFLGAFTIAINNIFSPITDTFRPYSPANSIYADIFLAIYAFVNFIAGVLKIILVPLIFIATLLVNVTKLVVGQFSFWSFLENIYMVTVLSTSWFIESISDICRAISQFCMFLLLPIRIPLRGFANLLYSGGSYKSFERTDEYMEVEHYVYLAGLNTHKNIRKLDAIFVNLPNYKTDLKDIFYELSLINVITQDTFDLIHDFIIYSNQDTYYSEFKKEDIIKSLYKNLLLLKQCGSAAAEDKLHSLTRKMCIEMVARKFDKAFEMLEKFIEDNKPTESVAFSKSLAKYIPPYSPPKEFYQYENKEKPDDSDTETTKDIWPKSEFCWDDVLNCGKEIFSNPEAARSKQQLDILQASLGYTISHSCTSKLAQIIVSLDSTRVFRDLEILNLPLLFLDSLANIGETLKEHSILEYLSEKNANDFWHYNYNQLTINGMQDKTAALIFLFSKKTEDSTLRRETIAKICCGELDFNALYCAEELSSAVDPEMLKNISKHKELKDKVAILNALVEKKLLTSKIAKLIVLSAVEESQIISKSLIELQQANIVSLLSDDQLSVLLTEKSDGINNTVKKMIEVFSTIDKNKLKIFIDHGLIEIILLGIVTSVKRMRELVELYEQLSQSTLLQLKGLTPEHITHMYIRPKFAEPIIDMLIELKRNDENIAPHIIELIFSNHGDLHYLLKIKDLLLCLNKNALLSKLSLGQIKKMYAQPSNAKHIIDIMTKLQKNYEKISTFVDFVFSNYDDCKYLLKIDHLLRVLVEKKLLTELTLNEVEKMCAHIDCAHNMSDSLLQLNEAGLLKKYAEVICSHADKPEAAQDITWILIKIEEKGFLKDLVGVDLSVFLNNSSQAKKVLAALDENNLLVQKIFELVISNKNWKLILALNTANILTQKTIEKILILESEKKSLDSMGSICEFCTLLSFTPKDNLKIFNILCEYSNNILMSMSQLFGQLGEEHVKKYFKEIVYEGRFASRILTGIIHLTLSNLLNDKNIKFILTKAEFAEELAYCILTFNSLPTGEKLPELFRELLLAQACSARKLFDVLSYLANNKIMTATNARLICQLLTVAPNSQIESLLNVLQKTSVQQETFYFLLIASMLDSIANKSIYYYQFFSDDNIGAESYNKDIAAKRLTQFILFLENNTTAFSLITLGQLYSHAAQLYFPALEKIDTDKNPEIYFREVISHEPNTYFSLEYKAFAKWELGQLLQQPDSSILRQQEGFELQKEVAGITSFYGKSENIPSFIKDAPQLLLNEKKMKGKAEKKCVQSFFQADVESQKKKDIYSLADIRVSFR